MTCAEAPTLQTERLILRGWRAEDFEPYARLLADPETARFITRARRPATRAQAWAEMAFFAGHWQLRGFGMFVVEARGSGEFLGRAGPIRPEGWPSVEIGWALAPHARGQGYATEAAAAAIGWAFERLGVDRLISVIHPDNAASRRVAERLGERRTADSFAPFGEPCDIWEVKRPRGDVRDAFGAGEGGPRP
jgi:RimJ/RimL family protein N-acetyltransferase